MAKTTEPACVSFHVDPSPHYPDDYPLKDNYYRRLIKAGDKVRCWMPMGSGAHDLRRRFVEGTIEEIDGILWIRVLRRYTTTHGYEPVEVQGPFRLIHNFINRCYYVAIIDKDNVHKLTPIKSHKEVKI